MLRIAVFVDAGYLYALCCLSRFRVMYPRVRTSLDIDAVLRELKREVAALDGGGGRLIRIYWYDGAPKAGMTAEQLRTASAPDVKLRLGSVNSFGEQKGVDALIAHDLSELARNHAIDIALLVSGDEDILVGVQTAQTFGVRVHLLGIDPAHSQAPRLMQEADVCHEWPAGLVADWITGNAAGAPREVSGTPDMHAVLAAIGTALDGQRDSVIETWERETRIAPEIDRHLMKALSAQLGRTLRPQEKPSLRQAFIDALRGDTVAPPLDGAAPDVEPETTWPEPEANEPGGELTDAQVAEIVAALLPSIRERAPRIIETWTAARRLPVDVNVKLLKAAAEAAGHEIEERIVVRDQFVAALRAALDQEPADPEPPELEPEPAGPS